MEQGDEGVNAMSDYIPNFKLGDRVRFMCTDENEQDGLADLTGKIISPIASRGVCKCVVEMDDAKAAHASTILTSTAQLVHQTCKACHCIIDSDGCGCNPEGA